MISSRIFQFTRISCGVADAALRTALGNEGWENEIELFECMDAEGRNPLGRLDDLFTFNIAYQVLREAARK